MNRLPINKKAIRSFVIVLFIIIGSISLFGYYNIYTMFKTYGGRHLLNTIITALELGIFLSAYFILRQLFKLPYKLSLLNKIKLIFLLIIISNGYLAFKPLQMPLFMIFSFALPIIIILYIITDTIFFIRKSKDKNVININ